MAHCKSHSRVERLEKSMRPEERRLQRTVYGMTMIMMPR